MKTKKIVVGAMAAAMLSLSVCSVAPVVAAGETVQISVSQAEANPGEQFTVEGSLADIPATGIQGLNFSLEFDASILSITSVTPGKLTETGASGADSTASMLPNFNSYTENEGLISLMWSTSLDDSTYWLKGEGVFCTVSGTVSESAAPGTTADIKVVATDREVVPKTGDANTEIDCGYMQNGVAVKYSVDVKNGGVTIKDSGSSVTPTGLLGDANLDGKVTVADAVAILQHVALVDKYGLEGQALINGDCYNPGDGVTAKDALAIQKLDAKVITELPEMP